MKNLTKLLFFATDWELFKKPNSIDIREQVVQDTVSVDSTKWYHPKLPDGKTNLCWGTIETIDGKQVCKEGTVDLYVYEHPDLKYRISDFPLATCKEGEFKNVTQKDCEIIRNVLYARDRKEKDSFYPNPKLFTNSWYILFHRLKYYSFLFIILPILVSLLYFYPKILLASVAILLFVCGVGYAFEQCIKEVKHIWNNA